MQLFCGEGSLLLKILVQHAGLYILVVLILVAGVPFVIAFNGVVENLTDLYIRINANGLNAEHFQSPVPRKTNIAKPSSNVHKQAKSADA